MNIVRRPNAERPMFVLLNAALAAAEAMRRIPVQSARGKKRLKHCGNMARV